MAFCSNHLGFSLICSVLQKLTFPLSVYFKCLCKQQRIQLITEPSSHSAAQCPASSDCESDSTGALGDRKELAERENGSGGHAGTHGNKEKWNGAGHEQLLVLGAQEAVKGYVWLQSWIGCAEVAGAVSPTGLALQVLAELWVQVYVGAERAGWCAGDGPRAVLLPAALCAPELCRVKVNKKLWLRCPHTDCPLVKVCESCCSPALVADGCWFVIRLWPTCRGQDLAGGAHSEGSQWAWQQPFRSWLVSAFPWHMMSRLERKMKYRRQRCFLLLFLCIFTFNTFIWCWLFLISMLVNFAIDTMLLEW